MLQAAAPVQRIAGSSQPVGAKLAANWTFRGDGLTDAIDRICDFAIAFAFIRNPATTLPTRPSLQSRTRDCSMSCVKILRPTEKDAS
jgi:hypothetical protein